MADEATLDGIFVGTDLTLEMVVYTTPAHTACRDITGWTIVLDMRKTDTATTSKLSKTGVVSGVFNSVPGSNTQKVTFTLTDDDLSATVFPGNDPTVRYSVKRTDPGGELILAFGDTPLNRVTQV